MKRFFLPSALILLSMTYSCMDDPEVQTDPQAAITGFTLGYYDVRFHDINYLGHDTTICKREAGHMYPMTIDQFSNRIYNIDSLAYGSEINAVTVSVSATGSVVYRYDDDPEKEIYAWMSYDSIDFTRPVIFSAVSTDGSFVRDYSIQVNIHKVFPDSLVWTDADTAGFSPFDIRSSAVRSDTIYAFGYESGTPSVTFRNILTGSWTAPGPLSGIDASTWDGNVIVRSDGMYTISGACLCSSADGINWTQGASGFRTLFSPADMSGIVWAAGTDGSLLSSEDMRTWTSQAMPAGFPDSLVHTYSNALATNENIVRTIAVGIGSDCLYADVWTKLSTDSVWTRTEPASYSSYRLPVLEGLSLISYDGALFAFGSGLDCFWQSVDNGITWHKCNRYAEEYSSWNQYMQMPSALAGSSAGFAYAVDRLGSIWIMTADGQVWRGAINRLNKR